jgi:hypothetical protein
MATNGSEITVAIPFVRVDASQNPNLVIKRGDDPSIPYFRSMVVAFASVRRFNANVQLSLITNEPPPQPFSAQLNVLGVQVREVPFSHRPPLGFARTFSASLYLLDALDSLTDEVTVLIDPDVLCIRSLHAMISTAGNAVGVLPIDYQPDHNVNGLTRSEAGELHALLGEPSICPTHFGGEVYVIPSQFLVAIRERCDEAWALSLDRHVRGMSKFQTEEHVLSFALRGVPTEDMQAFVHRIWTAHRLRQVDGRESRLTLWHLPAEKDRGFALIYLAATDPSSWFWHSSEDDFIDRAGRAMGLHHRSVSRLALDFVGQSLHALRAKRRSPTVSAPRS